MDIQEQTQQEPVSTPKKAPLISTPTAIVTAGVLIALALIFSGKGLGDKTNIKNNQQKPSDEQALTTPPGGSVKVLATDHVRGDVTKAEVVIVEYSDSDCPFCQRFHETMQDVLKKYGTKVAWVYRYFPLNIHPNAGNEAYALECVSELGGNDAFWNYLDSIIDLTVSPDKSKSILSGLAKDLGIDQKLFESCIASPKVRDLVKAQSDEAQSLGAQGTPYSIAIGKDGKQVVIAGAYPIESVIKTIDSLMK